MGQTVMSAKILQTLEELEEKTAMAEIRARFMKKVSEKSSYSSPLTERMDAVCEEGVAWMDGLADL